jgi:hypothetical protein
LDVCDVDDRSAETVVDRLLQSDSRAAGQAAKDAVRANGGLGEYYSEKDTRAPV